MSTPPDPDDVPFDYPAVERLPTDIVPEIEQGNLAMLLDALRTGKAYRLTPVRNLDTGAVNTMISIVVEELATGDPEEDAVLHEHVIPNLPEVVPVALLLGDIEDVGAAYEMLPIPPAAG